MLTKRIIACLDMKDGRTVKGVKFGNLRDMGDPVELAAFYASEGADELVFLDISATAEKRKTLASLVRRIAQKINIPFTVGGGINSLEGVNILLGNGADKITVNTAAIKDPRLMEQIAKQFGSQCLVVAIDTKWKNGDWLVYAKGGMERTVWKTKEWVKAIEASGGGELLLTSIDHDGTRDGYAIQLTKEISSLINIPVIASGGAGNETHFAEIFNQGKADAALAAGIFHDKSVSIPELKKFLQSNKIEVRI